MFVDIPAITDLCLNIQHYAVHVTEKGLQTTVLQECDQWLSLVNLSDREKDNILDMPIVPGGIFGLALASMQRC